MKGVMRRATRQGHRWSAYNLGITTLVLLSWILVCSIYFQAPSPADPRNMKSISSGKDWSGRGSRHGKVLNGSKHSTVLNLGRFGKMMVDMVTKDLPFTIFVPDEAAVDKIVKSCPPQTEGFGAWNLVNQLKDTVDQKNLTGQFKDMSRDTIFSESEASSLGCVTALVSRLMSFSIIPRQVRSHMVPDGGELEVETLSGYKLYLAQDANRGFLVNNHSCPVTDIALGLLVIHLLDGVLMDSLFANSIT